MSDYRPGRLGVGGSNPLAPTNKSPGNTGLFAFLAVAAERTNPQQNHPKSPECERNHRSNHRSVPGRFTLLGEGSSRAGMLMEVCCAALFSRPFAAAPYFDWDQHPLAWPQRA
jgi:hypothetical protein